MPLFIIALIGVPIFEIYLLISVGEEIGARWTIVAVIATALLGAALVRQQGLATLAKFNASRGTTDGPAFIVFEGLVLLMAGIFLLTPGFFTDALGFLCLVPALRAWALRVWISKHSVTVNQNQKKSSGDIVDGEFRRLDD
ncbi:MAG: FxsA family protein [Proteobacteria bacterium]|nr:FxsA family protein [Pseudomonadota bacterium]MBT4357952.1 FxsA family protein [Pseudomonadota bacterium]MBT4988139.1 FxsA family protein [Pseudomonadota bacterium]MBT5190158.1 FxsA family protein [Pseudomonadota bacterium]MBT5625493.1 FxsA family protein [Pseudomonadota bacterium]